MNCSIATMGQCIAAYERWQEVKTKRILDEMTQASVETTETYQKQANAQAGKVRELQANIDNFKRRVRGRALTPKEKLDLLDLMKQKKMGMKRNEFYANLVLGAEGQQFGIQTVAVSTQVAKHSKTLVKGYKKIKDRINPDVIHGSLDKMEDVNDEINEMADALQSRVGENAAVSHDEMEEMEKEIDAEFGDGSGPLVQQMDTLPVSKNTEKYARLHETEEDPVVAEQILLDSEA